MKKNILILILGFLFIGNSVSANNYAFGVNVQFSPVDATTYYGCVPLTYAGSALQATQFQTNSLSSVCQFSEAGHLSFATLRHSFGGVGSAQNSACYLRVNDTTDYLFSNTLPGNVAVTWASVDFDLDLVASDFFTIKCVSPTWTTNPTSYSASFVAVFTPETSASVSPQLDLTPIIIPLSIIIFLITFFGLIYYFKRKI